MNAWNELWCYKKYLIVLMVIFYSCRSEDTTTTTTNDQTENKIKIDINDTKQTIRNFGASDAWTCQYIGKWPDAKRNQVADWLFSKDVDENGKPKGIGLSLWRFNVGAGSSAQQDISDPWRRTECFLKSDGTYDWSKQSGQQWFLQAAKARGVDKFLAFTNSPPVTMTRNGKAFSSQGDEANLSADHYVNFANFLTDVLDHFKSSETPFNYVSPFNEPQWDWTGNGQEGSPYKNTEIFNVTKALDSTLTQRGLETTIQIGEAGKLNYLFETADKPGRGDQINQFFNNASPLYLGQYSHVGKIISGHSYFTTAPVETLRDVRAAVAGKLAAASVPLEFWQSEYCVLGGQEEITATGRDTGMDPALYVARIIHHDLTVANASAWSWWLAVSIYDYKDGLIYADKNTSDGNITDTKLMWALGNFSRFVRPGAVRLGVTAENFSADNPRGVMVSSFFHPQDKQLVIVAINYSNSDVTTSLEISHGQAEVFHTYITGPGEDEKLKRGTDIKSDEKITIPKRTVVTLVSDLN